MGPATGRPVHNALVWQDTRTDALCRRAGAARDARTGSATHRAAARRLLRRPEDCAGCSTHVPGCGERAERGELLFGTMESWLIWNLTGGTDGGVHVTDVTNASRTC